MLLVPESFEGGLAPEESLRSRHFSFVRCKCLQIAQFLGDSTEIPAHYACEVPLLKAPSRKKSINSICPYYGNRPGELQFQ
jgi:hypothetical protein